MRQILLSFLLFLFVPIVVHASDHCTNPDEYTIDKRCYVTDEQKQQKPYNAVVALVDGSWIYCTGTIAKWNRVLTNKYFVGLDDLLYLFTAKHCSDINDDGIPDRQLHIKLQNGKKMDVTLVGAGNYDLKNPSNSDKNGDWAVYRLPVDLIKDTSGYYHVNMISAENTKNKTPWLYADADGQQDGRVVGSVGYGSLKIMSDSEIEKFKQKYIDYLEKDGVTDMSYDNTGIIENGGINMLHDKPVAFKNKLRDGFFSYYYWKDLFQDNKELKVSICLFNNNNSCQRWGGNSGGPTLDISGNIVGIITRGYYVIGGEKHARYDKDVISGHIYKEMNKLKLGPGMIWIEQ